MSAEEIAQPEQDAADRARERAASLRKGLEWAAELYAQAVAEEDWRHLGYESAAAWHEGEFGGHRLTVEARRQVHELLSGDGMSQRQIAAVTGVPRSTVQHDLSPDVTPVAQNGPPPLSSEKGALSARPAIRKHRAARSVPPPVTPPAAPEAAQDPAVAQLAAQARTDQLSAEIDALEEVRSRLQRELHDQAAELAEARQLHDAARARTDELEAENVRLRERVRELEEENAGLTELLSTATDPDAEPVPDPVAAVPDAEPEPPAPDPAPLRRFASWDAMEREFDGLTGTCQVGPEGQKCGKPAPPGEASVWKDAEDGKEFIGKAVLCESCAGVFEGQGHTVTRPDPGAAA